MAAASAGWAIDLAGLTMELHLTEAGQVGLFPEHAARLPWLADRVADRTGTGSVPEVLSLFAYTGLATVALARAGARVTHVDASRPAVTWARKNAERNGLARHPVRWIVEDARAYARREVRRERRYDGVVLDPPTYGHGADGSAGAWRLEDDLPELLATIDHLLTPDGFVLLSAHTEGYDPERLAGLLSDGLGGPAGRARSTGASLDAGPLALEAASGASLLLGAYAALDRGAR